MAYEIYQSRYKGYEIDKRLDDVGDLNDDVADLKKSYDANKVIMPDTKTLPVHLADKFADYDTSTQVAAAISAATTDMATKTQVAADIAAAAYTLPKATNTTLGGVMVDNTTITVDANGVISGASSIDKIEDIGDVTLTNIQKDQALIWDGAGWVNGTVATSGGSNDVGTVFRKETVLWTGKQTASGTINLSDDISNYDCLMLTWSNSVTDENRQLVEEILNPKNLIAGKTYLLCRYASQFTIVTAPTSTSINFNVNSGNVCFSKIIGISYTSVETLPNRPTLEKISESENGTLLFDGNEIKGGGMLSSQIIDVETVNVKVGPSNTHPIALYTYTNNSKEDVYIVLNGLSSTDTGSNQGFLSAELDNVQFSKLLLTTSVNMATCFTTKVGPGQEFSVKGDWIGSHSGCSWAIIGSLIVYTTAGAGNLYLSYEDYSEEERVVGKWTDGKPIYRKIIQTTTPKVTIDGTNVEKTISIADLGVDRCISLSGFFINTVNATVMFNSAIALTFSKPYAHMLWCSNGSIGMDVNRVSYGDRPATIILEYTKAADAENSFNPSMITDNLIVAGAAYENYSEDEIVVGKWIDGKPVYRKCFNFTSPSAATDGNAKTYNLPNILIDSVIDYGVFIKNSNGVVFKNGNNGDAAFKTDFLNAWIRNNNHATSPNSLAIIIGTSTAFHSRPMHLILEYTKTTDAENSFTPSMVLGGVSNETASDADVQEVFA